MAGVLYIDFYVLKFYNLHKTFIQKALVPDWMTMIEFAYQAFWAVGVTLLISAFCFMFFFPFNICFMLAFGGGVLTWIGRGESH